MIINDLVVHAEPVADRFDDRLKPVTSFRSTVR
jgi:hypothetical protein